NNGSCGDVGDIPLAQALDKSGSYKAPNGSSAGLVLSGDVRPGRNLSVHVPGNITISGSITNHYKNGGEISLFSDSGNVTVASYTTVDTTSLLELTADGSTSTLSVGFSVTIYTDSTAPNGVMPGGVSFGSNGHVEIGSHLRIAMSGRQPIAD